MLWQVKQIKQASGVSESLASSSSVAVATLAQAVAGQPVALELAIRRILWELRGADAGNTEAALERAEQQLAALLCHDRSETA